VVIHKPEPKPKPKPKPKPVKKVEERPKREERPVERVPPSRLKTLRLRAGDEQYASGGKTDASRASRPARIEPQQPQYPRVLRPCVLKGVFG
jgi:protein TonB